MSFNAVEINSSFYRSHRCATYERWRDITPANFRFSAKMPRSVTHECALRRCRSELRKFIDEISGLGRKLSVILVQLLPVWHLSPRLGHFFELLAAHSSVRLACEPRHPSWFSARASDFLQRHGIARVAADPSKNPGVICQVVHAISFTIGSTARPRCITQRTALTSCLDWQLKFVGRFRSQTMCGVFSITRLGMKRGPMRSNFSGSWTRSGPACRPR